MSKFPLAMSNEFIQKLIFINVSLPRVGRFARYSLVLQRSRLNDYLHYIARYLTFMSIFDQNLVKFEG